jgi:carbon monoxide dehydrogenase subunit G
MKLHEEFLIAEQVGTVWKFFEQPEQVANCLPGVELVEVLDQDNVNVRVMQAVGPLTATFDARVSVLERIPEEMIRFRAAGRSIRGAIGNVRTENTVVLRDLPDGTSVSIDGEMVLAGALGSVGQKVLTRQASNVTAQFAANLQRALRGEAPVPAGVGVRTQPGPDGIPLAGVPAASGGWWPTLTPERWSQAAAALSAVSALLSAIVLVRQRRRPQ